MATMTAARPPSTASSGRGTAAKRAYSARRVRLADLDLIADRAPKAGDLVLARVDRLGQHDGLQLPSGRRADLFPGDEIVVAYGHRYAPDQFEAEVPEDLSPCHLVAAGGIAARELCRHARMRSPTEITPLGLLDNGNGRPANLADWALGAVPPSTRRPHTIAVVGTCMNAGKTTTVANLIHGLVASGKKVGAAKITGTAAGGDTWLMADAGASHVLDFTDAGFATTYRTTLVEVQGILAMLTGHLAASGVDTIVLEIADGLFQRETKALLGSPEFAGGVDAVLFAAGDALAATAGVDWLARRGVPVHGVSGVLTSSPLAIREAELSTGLPVLTIDLLRDPDCAAHLHERLEVAR